MSLARIIGRNKAFIEQVLPHIASMMCDSLVEVVEGSEVIVVGHELRDGGKQLVDILRPGQLVIDLVKVASGGFSPAAYEGICW